MSEEEYIEAPELPATLEGILIFAANEAREALLESGELAPFTAVLLEDDQVMIEYIVGSAEELYDKAEESIKKAEGALAYAFCYDGEVDGDSDEEKYDAIIVEGGLPGDPVGYAVCCFYQVEGDVLSIEEEVIYIGDCPNYLEACECECEEGECCCGDESCGCHD